MEDENQSPESLGSSRSSDPPSIRHEFSQFRSEVRRDVLDWWETSHPDAESPETIRQVIALWFSEQKQGIRSLPEKRANQLRGNAQNHAHRVAELRALEAEDVEVVTKAVRSAHWTDNSRASWSLVLDDFVEDHSLLIFPLGFLLLIFPFGIAWSWMFQVEEFKNFGAAGMMAMWAFLVLGLAIHGRILVLLRATAPKLVQLWRLVVMGGAGYLLLQDSWRSSLRELALRQTPHAPQNARDFLGYSDLCAAYSLRWLFAFVFVAFLFSLGNSLLYRVGPKEPAYAVTTSQIILQLLSLASWSQTAMERSDAESSTEGFRPYLASEERRHILRCLDRIAHIAEGRWRRSLRVGDPIADNAASALGEGLAVSARKWKSVAAVGGERLEEMNQTFALALVHAAKGNWELLASEVSGRELLRRRALRTVRHFLALGVMIGSAYTILVDPFGFLGKTTNPAVASILLTFAAILSISIDPTIVERLGNASKVGANFSAKK